MIFNHPACWLILFFKILSITQNSASECLGTFCADAEEYPQDVMDHILKQTPSLQLFLTPTTENDDFRPEAARKTVLPQGDESFCDAHVKMLSPMKATNVNNETRWIVQSEHAKQYINVEVCIPEAVCKFRDVFPDGYKLHCHQKFLKKRLLSADLNISIEGLTFLDVYDVPSCCVCMIKKVERTSSD